MRFYYHINVILKYSSIIYNYLHIKALRIRGFSAVKTALFPSVFLILLGPPFKLLRRRTSCGKRIVNNVSPIAVNVGRERANFQSRFLTLTPLPGWISTYLNHNNMIILFINITLNIVCKYSTISSSKSADFVSFDSVNVILAFDILENSCWIIAWIFKLSES